jgi:hypothetical protein
MSAFGDQRDQIIRPSRDWLRGRGEDRSHEDSSVRPRNKNINNFVACNKSTNRMELIDENQKGSHAMLDIMKTDEEILAFDVPDEALEIATGRVSDKANFTLGACTGLSECPG